jgi:hypothetical protein
MGERHVKLRHVYIFREVDHTAPSGARAVCGTRGALVGIDAGAAIPNNPRGSVHGRGRLRCRPPPPLVLSQGTVDETARRGRATTTSIVACYASAPSARAASSCSSTGSAAMPAR